MYRLSFLFVFLFSLCLNCGKAQSTSFVPDTLKISLAEAEQRFVDKSLAVIASYYDVSIANTQVTEAKLWNNPNLSYSQTFYDPSTGKYFDNSSTGNFDIQVSQLFSIAGKHTNTVKLAKLNAKKSEWQFKDVVRSLKYELYKDFEIILADQQKEKLYEFETVQLDKLMLGEKQQLQLGAVAQNEVTRLNAEIQELQNQSIQNFNELLDAEQELKTLLNYDQKIFVEAVPPNDVVTPLPTVDEAISVAEQNRPDYQLSKTEIEYEKQNIRLQRSLSVPDLNLFVEQDQAGSYVRNYKAIGVSFDLPVFNRNQAQIKIAKMTFDKAVTSDSLQTNSLHNAVVQAYSSYLNINRHIQSVSADFSAQLEQLNQNALSNYSKRYINLVDFLDQVRTYTQSAINLIDLKHQYHDAADTFNFITGTAILK